jgi:hypothetical protein
LARRCVLPIRKIGSSISWPSLTALKSTQLHATDELMADRAQNIVTQSVLSELLHWEYNGSRKTALSYRIRYS